VDSIAAALAEFLRAAVAGSVQRAVPPRFSIGTEMSQRERVTLEIGSSVAFATLAFGIQFGRWPLWTGAIALIGYLAWTLLYSEATIQAGRWRRCGRSLKFPRLSTAQPTAPPA
jgi:hypothetical protein